MRGVLKVTPTIIFVLECAYTFLQIFECSLLSKLETITPTLEPVLCDPKSEQCCIVEIISDSLWYKFSVNNYLVIVFADKTWNFHKHSHFEAVLGDPNSDQCCMQLAIWVLEYQRIIFAGWPYVGKISSEKRSQKKFKFDGFAKFSPQFQILHAISHLQMV